MQINQLKAGAILSYVSIFISVAVSFIYTPFMLRHMGQSEYGLFTLALTIVSYLSLMDFGFGTAIVRYSSLYLKEKNDKIPELYGLFLKMYSIIGIVCFIVGICFYLSTSVVFSKSLTVIELEKIKIIILIIVIYLSISFPFSVFSAIITSYEKFIFLKIMNIVRSLLVPLFMIPLLLLNYKSIAMTVVVVGVGILINLFNVFYCIKKLKVKFVFKNSEKSLVISILSFSVLVFGKDVFERITWSSGQFILGANLGVVSVSIFAIAIQMKGYFETFSKTISNLFLPRIMSILNDENFSEKFLSLFIRIGRIQFHVLSYILVIYLLIGEEFICLWAGENYRYSYGLSLWIIVPYIFPLIQSLGSLYLQAINKLKILLYIYLIEAILVLTCTIFLPEMIGIKGAAVALTVGIVISEIILANIYWKVLKINIKYFWIEISKILFPVIIFVSIALYFISNFNIASFNNILCAGFIITVVYFIYIYKYALNVYEKGLITNTLRKILKK